MPRRHAPRPGLGQKDHERRRFENAEQWAKRSGNPSRADWQKPDEMIRALAPASQATVADIGAGTGYFAVHNARAVPQRSVIRVDIKHDRTSARAIDVK